VAKVQAKYFCSCIDVQKIREQVSAGHFQMSAHHYFSNMLKILPLPDDCCDLWWSGSHSYLIT